MQGNAILCALAKAMLQKYFGSKQPNTEKKCKDIYLKTGIFKLLMNKRTITLPNPCNSKVCGLRQSMKYLRRSQNNILLNK